MSEFSLDDVVEGVESVKNRGRELLPWMPDPFVCDDCRVYCEATRVYDPQLVDAVDAWECPDCGSRFYRDDSVHELRI